MHSIHLNKRYCKSVCLSSARIAQEKYRDNVCDRVSFKNQQKLRSKKTFLFAVHYSSQTYESVLNSVCQSLSTLTTALGAKIDESTVDYGYSRPGSSNSRLAEFKIACFKFDVSVLFFCLLRCADIGLCFLIAI